MDALVRHAKKIRGVPDTQVEPTSQQPSSIARGLLRDRVLARRALPRGGRCIDHPAGFRWEPDLIDELHGISVVAIETQRLADPAPSAPERPSLRVAAGHARDACDPPAVVAPVVDHRVIVHCSHPSPKHGARSRAIAASNPRPRSWPTCTGMVV